MYSERKDLTIEIQDIVAAAFLAQTKPITWQEVYDMGMKVISAFQRDNYKGDVNFLCWKGYPEQFKREYGYMYDITDEYIALKKDEYTAQDALIHSNLIWVDSKISTLIIDVIKQWYKTEKKEVKYDFTILSDFHFNDEKLVNFERGKNFDSMREHNEKVKEVWKQAVSTSKVFYFLGDFGDLPDDELKELGNYFAKFSCKKIFIKGNHDTQEGMVRLNRFGIFDEFHRVPVWITKRICLSHEPVAMYADSLNIHGHLHEAKLVDNSHFNANIHLLKYTPLTSKRVVNKLMPKLDSYKRWFLAEPWSDDVIILVDRDDIVYDKETGRLDTAASLEMRKKDKQE